MKAHQLKLERKVPAYKDSKLSAEITDHFSKKMC